MNIDKVEEVQRVVSFHLPSNKIFGFLTKAANIQTSVNDNQ